MERYIRTIEEPSHEGNIGIWWFYNGKVVGEYCPHYTGNQALDNFDYGG